MELFLASNNGHKLEEFSDLLIEAGFALNLNSARVLGGMPEVDETAPDFEGNARLKAEALVGCIEPTAWVLADDSGLEVDALKGAPGVRSARFAGEDATDGANNAKLLKALTAVEPSRRTARFRCVLVLLSGTGELKTFSGSCEGQIGLVEKGTAGFGYDPLFIPDGYDRSFAELGSEIKQQLSHRAKAFASMVAWLRSEEG